MSANLRTPMKQSLMIFTIGFIIVVKISSAQTNFQKSYENFLPSAHIELSDGSFVVAGQQSPFDTTRLLLFKCDAEGNITWSKSFTSNFEQMACFDIEETHDGGFILTGSATNGNLSIGYNDTCLVLKTDSIGNLQWYHWFSEPQFPRTTGIEIHQTNDHGYALLVRLDDGTSINSTSTLIKMDSMGVMEWQSTFSFQDSTNIYYPTFIATSDGYFICGVNSSYLPAGFLLIKVDLNGNASWVKRCLGYYLYPIVMKTTSQGDLVIAGDESGGLNLFLMKLNSIGDLIWAKKYDFDNSNQAFPADLVMILDQSVILAGKGFTNNYQDSWAWISRIDSSGNMLWSRRVSPYFYNINNSFSCSVDMTAENTYSVCSEVADWYWSYRKIQITKFTSDGLSGCLSSNISYTQQTAGISIFSDSVLVNQPLTLEEENMLVTELPVSITEVTYCFVTGDETPNQYFAPLIYPNPVLDEIILQLETNTHHIISISNTLGEILFQTETNSSTLQVDVSHFTSGIYFVVVKDEKGNAVTKKVVKM